jgi:hypothetical protein
MLERLRDTGGFALAIAVFALVLLAVIVAGGYFTATQEFQIGRSMRTLTTSFYSGEAGVRDVLADWDPAVYAELAIDDTIHFGPTRVSGGGEYSSFVTRVGAPADSAKRYFYIEAAGRPGRARRGERRQAAMVSAWFPNLCCEATVKVVGDIIFSPGGSSEIISGNNLDPPAGWSGSVCAGLPTDSVPGAAISSTTTISQPAKIRGSPTDFYVDASLNEANALDFGDYTYAALATRADHEFAGDYVMYDSQPTLDGSGECDESNLLNWGETSDENHPCFDFFPVVHVAGNLILEGSGRSQGILLVDGALEIHGPYNFYGVAIASDSIIMSGSAYVYGGAVTRRDLRYTGPNPRFVMSQCAVYRAQRLSSLARPELISPRAWVELF